MLVDLAVADFAQQSRELSQVFRRGRWPPRLGVELTAEDAQSAVQPADRYSRAVYRILAAAQPNVAGDNAVYLALR